MRRSHRIVARPNSGGAIEASSIVSHNGYFYLLVSFDSCCKGVNSTYNTNVGRASKITGPYTDKAGKLQVRPINFDANDWVTLGNPLFP